MAKTSSTLPGFHAVRSLQSTGKRSIPLTSKSAFLDLFASQNRRERLLQERARVRVRREQISKQLSGINKDMKKSLQIALGSMTQGELKTGTGKGKGKFTKSMVLSY